MRGAFFAAVMFISACAGEGLRLAPPAGVDFSGHWKLNVADSDDPLHLLQIANAQAAAAADNSANSGRGGRGGQGTGNPGLRPPATPPVGVLADASRFPGKQLDIKQVGGVLTFGSSGQTLVCQPGEGKKLRHHDNAADRDAPLPAARDAPPPKCGGDKLHDRMRQVHDPYIRERLGDLEDMAGRLLAELAGAAERPPVPPGAILVARRLGPAELLAWHSSGIAGLVIEEASPAGHAAILARASACRHSAGRAVRWLPRSRGMTRCSMAMKPRCICDRTRT